MRLLRYQIMRLYGYEIMRPYTAELTLMIRSYTKGGR